MVQSVASLAKLPPMTSRERRRGNCYVTCESLYHLLGGKRAGYTPHTLRHEGDVHWYLVHRIGSSSGAEIQLIVDPTASQFKTPPDYTQGRARGFLTKQPSKRARAMMDLLVWQSLGAPYVQVRTARPGGARPRGRRTTPGVKKVQRAQVGTKHANPPTDWNRVAKDMARGKQ